MLDKFFIIITTFIILFKFVSSTDYCSLCENGTHTMCQYKGPAQNCPGYRRKELSAAEKKYIVDIHNDIRNHVASGMETRGALGSQPAASDMSMLEWDEELGVIAQRWADQCIKVNDTRQHDICKRTERFEVGQNILTAITTEPDLPELSVLIFNWYQQVTNMVPSDVDVFLGVKKGKFLIGQYTQLVWSQTRYVGCGIVTFTERDYVVGTYQHRLVCNYGPAGNVIGEVVYQRGRPCTKCINKRCDTVRTSLCQGIDLKDSKIKLNNTKNVELLQTDMIPFNLNNSNKFAKKMHNAICLNPDELTVSQCITGVSKSNITRFPSDYNIKDNLNYITFAAMASDNFELHRPDQATLKNLIALWKKLKLKNITDTLNTYMPNNWSENITSIKDDHMEPVNEINGGTEVKDKDQYNTVKYITKPDNKLYKSELNKSLQDIFKDTRYLYTVMPSTTVTTGTLENIINRNITVFDSSQVVQKPIIIHTNVDIGDTAKNFRQKAIDLDYLENGIVLGDGGEKHYRYLKDSRHRALQSYFKLNQDFSDMGNLELPSGGHFRKIKGIWHDGHCKCEGEDRADSEKAESDTSSIILPTVALLLMLTNIILLL